MKKVYVIPGCGAETEDYPKLSEMLRNHNHIIIPVKINWRSNSFARYIEESKPQLADATESDTVLGFSYGGNISLFSNIPARQIICSTPDIFDKARRSTFDFFGRGNGICINWDEVDDLPVEYKAKSTDIFVAGSKERKYTQYAREFVNRFDAKLKIIEGAKHCINDLEYVKGLEEVI